jgi:hypothetical protein
MNFKFLGGPYDKMAIEAALIERRARMEAVTGDLGRRLFLLMPPREDWERASHGEKVRPRAFVPYEQAPGQEGVFHAASAESLEKARSEARLKIHSRARPALSVLAPDERRLVIDAADALQHETPGHWPKERALPISPDEPVYLLRVSPSLRAIIRVTSAGEIELEDIVRKEALQLFGNGPGHAARRH